MKTAKWLKDFLKGKKTYIVSGAMIVLGILQGFEVFEISEAGWIVIGAFGFGFLRAGVNQIGTTIKETQK